MFDVDQDACKAQSGLDTNTPATMAIGSVAPLSEPDAQSEKVAVPQLFAKTIHRAKRLMGELVLHEHAERRLNAELMVEAVRLFHDSKAHPSEFDALMASLGIKVNSGRYILYRRVICVLFSCLTKGEGGFADMRVSKTRVARYTQALAYAVKMSEETQLEQLADKIEASGGYSALYEYEKAARSTEARTARATQPPPEPRGRPPCGHVKFDTPIKRPTLMLVYPDGAAFVVQAPKETIDRFASEIDRAA